MVLLCAYATNNVHLMLLSGIGAPYDPVSQKGVIGKNYCYQTGAQATLFFEGRHFNPFMSAGGLNVVIDDYNTNWDFDRGKYGYIGGANISGGMTGGRPIGYRPGPAGTPAWGTAWKAATPKWDHNAMTLGSSRDVVAHPHNLYHLHPTHPNALR